MVAVGPKTAAQLRTVGIIADHIPDSFSSEGILSSLPQQLTNNAILWPTGHKAKPDLKDQLEARGASVTRLNVYHTTKPDQQKWPLFDGDIIIFDIFVIKTLTKKSI